MSIVDINNRASFKSKQQIDARLLQQQNFLDNQLEGSQLRMNQQQQQQANQLAALSNPMIVNSQPYNPSQQQQQRCIGLDQQQQQQQQQQSTMTISRQLANSLSLSTPSSSQQNSLYGSSFGQQQQLNHQHVAGSTIQSHLFDSANHLQQSIFDSSCDISTSSASAAAAAANNNNKFNAADLNQISRDNSRRLQVEAELQKQQQQQQQQQSNQNNDVSFYSPSSSTSLLYHIYEQMPNNNDQPQQHFQQNSHQHQQAANNVKKSNTTILNPANLFSNTNQQQLHPLPMQLHQAQVSDLQKTLQQQQQCYPPTTFHTLNQQLQQQQQQPFVGATTLNHPHHQYLTSNHQLMLDTVMRQHQTANRLNSRPLSSSDGSSSMSGQSSGQPIAYGRQLRQQTSIGAGSSINKSQSNLASVLQSSNTLNHLGILPPTGAAVVNQNKSAAFVGSGGRGVFGNSVNSNGLVGGRWKQMNKRARNLLYEYRTIVKCSIILILLAFTLIKLTLLSASSSPSSSSQSQVTSALANQQQVLLLGSSSSSSSSNSLIYPPSYATSSSTATTTKQFVDQLTSSNSNNFPQSTGFGSGDDETLDSEKSAQQTATAPDVLKSKFLLGSFVILSQNYTQSPTQRSLLAERIVKLMDQVFLSTEVRKVYSRMEVTNIRPNYPRGISVNCTIILSDSISYAAQQFGYALFDSLLKTNERLANQENYIIDRNSIRFNTVPDKDLKDMPREVLSGSSIQINDFANTHQQEMPVAPSVIKPTDNSPVDSPIDQSASSSGSVESQVVWSEWSQWSSCVDKNGNCDPARIHSRLRKCVQQNTGEKVEAILCQQRYGLHDLTLEVDNCANTCKQQEQQQQPVDPIMSDAPSMVGPHTAPSVVIGGSDSTFTLHDSNKPKSSAFTSKAEHSPYLTQNSQQDNLSPQQQHQQQQQQQQQVSTLSSSALFSSANSVVGTTERIQPAVVSQANELLSSSLATPTIMPQTIDLTNSQQQQQQQLSNSQISCKNCTNDDICFLSTQSKVPFCAKIKDRSDESGCGGWCKAQNQLCQPVGQNAFKCIHDSECLAEEWRCHDSACIPLSKRCDGHSNCYDSSDERDCPIN